MKRYLLGCMTALVAVWGCDPMEQSGGAAVGEICQSDGDCSQGLKCAPRGAQSACYDPLATTTDAAPMKSPDAGAPQTCAPAPTCNWCQGVEQKDAQGCVTGFVCANGADPCTTKPCTSTDPLSCPSGTACRDGLCWGGIPPVVCTAGSAACEDLGHTRICNATGTGYDIDECPPYQRCEKGACVSAGKVKGSLFASIAIANDRIPLPPIGNVMASSVSASFTYDTTTPVAGKALPIDTCELITGTITNYVPPDPTKDVPFDGGTILVTGIPSGPRTLVYDTQTKQYLLNPPLGTTEFPYGATLTLNGSGVGGTSSGLVGSAFNAQIQVPLNHQVLQPKPIGGGNTCDVVTQGQPFQIKWSNPTNKETVHLTLFQNFPITSSNPPSTYYVVRCDVLDDGEFTIPAALLASFPPVPMEGAPPWTVPTADMSVFFTLEAKNSFQAAGLSEGEAKASLMQISRFIIK
jgi:hypothetical protein